MKLKHKRHLLNCYTQIALPKPIYIFKITQACQLKSLENIKYMHEIYISAIPNIQYRRIPGHEGNIVSEHKGC